MPRLYLALALSLAWSLHGQTADDLSKATPSERDAGSRLFGVHCALCHGVDGSGGKGPDLRKPVYERANTDAALIRLMRNGGGGMPGNWFLADDELRSLGGFVRSLGANTATEIAGDPVRGRTVYEQQGCSGCHIVNGHGGSLGPDLSRIGLSRGPAHLSESLLDPAKDLDKAARVVEITTAAGGVIRGMLINEDVFAVQLRDASNRYHSLDKADLRAFRKLEDQSLMPNFRGSLSDSDLADLVAYLASLRGAE